MLIPKINTRHKIRDAKICSLYVQAKDTVVSIATMFKISTTRVYKILYDNRELIQANKGWEKSKRVHWLKRHIEKSDTTRKDTADLQAQLRTEIEGDKSLVDQSQHTQIFVKVEGIDGADIQATRSTVTDIKR